jgi:hypothetical protein
MVRCHQDSRQTTSTTFLAYFQLRVSQHSREQRLGYVCRPTNVVRRLLVLSVPFTRIGTLQVKVLPSEHTASGPDTCLIYTFVNALAGCRTAFLLSRIWARHSCLATYMSFGEDARSPLFSNQSSIFRDQLSFINSQLVGLVRPSPHLPRTSNTTQWPPQQKSLRCTNSWKRYSFTYPYARSFCRNV